MIKHGGAVSGLAQQKNGRKNRAPAGRNGSCRDRLLVARHRVTRIHGRLTLKRQAKPESYASVYFKQSAL